MGNAFGYLDLGGNLKGGSEDARHIGWTELISLDHAIDRNIDPYAKLSEARNRGRAILGGIDVQKMTDQSSPGLAVAVCECKPFPVVRIELARSSSSGDESFFRIELENALIIDYAVHAHDFDFGIIETIETLTFLPSVITWTYSKKDAQGNTCPPVSRGWNVETNKKL